MIGVIILVEASSVIACTPRRCAVSEFDVKDPNERVVELGETATNIFTIKSLGFFGVGDSRGNTVAFYPIWEQVWRKGDPRIEEQNPFDLIMNKILKCKPGF